MSEQWISAYAAWERVSGMTASVPIPGPATANIRASAAAQLVRAEAAMFIVTGKGQKKSHPNYIIPAEFWDMSVEVEDWQQGRFVGVQRDIGWEIRCEALGVAFEAVGIKPTARSTINSTDNPWPITTVQKSASVRPKKHDWEGAMIHLIALSNSPDGLPTGYGAQAEIARLMALWFQKAHSIEPANSELRQRAQRILNEIELLAKPAGATEI
jgi:hypothetical protein